jgi:hypothetical protein
MVHGKGSKMLNIEEYGKRITKIIDLYLESNTTPEKIEEMLISARKELKEWEEFQKSEKSKTN